MLERKKERLFLWEYNNWLRSDNRQEPNEIKGDSNIYKYAVLSEASM